MKKIYKNLGTLVMLLVLTSAAVFAQRTVTGTVIDEFDTGLPGVSVLVKGTTTGTATDIDGNFSLNVPNDDAVLVFSFIGYTKVEQAVGNRSVIDVNLQPDEQTLTEMVVTGYTIDSRRETTGAISTVDPKDLSVIPTGNIEQTLQGRVSGVTVITNGQPGTSSIVRIRGFGAFGGNEPLYVVDGVPVESTDFLNPDDIASTTVLKDAAAASIYGARAANGVIIYTTKRGKRGDQKLRVDLNVMYGATDPGKGLDMMNPQDQAEYTWLAERNAAAAVGREVKYEHEQFGTGPAPVIPYYLQMIAQDPATGDLLNIFGQPGPLSTSELEQQRAWYNVDKTKGAVYQLTRAATGEGTDWYDAITRVAPLQRYSLGINGGSETSRFYVGLGYQNQQGILINNSFRRFTFRANSEFDVTDKIRIGENFQGTYRQALGLGGGEDGGRGISDDESDILFAFRMPTIIPLYDEFGGYAGTAAKGFNNPANPLARREGLKNNRGFGASAFGNVYVEVEPVEDLVFRTSIGINYTNFYNWNYSRYQYENSENAPGFGYNENSGFEFGYTFTNTMNWKKQFDKHSLDVLLGQEALNDGSGRIMSASGLNPFSTDPDYINISNLPVSSRLVGSSQYKGVNFSSLFARVNYGFNDKYLLSTVVRRDGSSRFGENNRFGVFPAFSLAWRISSESFLHSATWVDDLKMRVGWGQMGNSNNVDPNNQYFLYGGSVAASSYDITGSNGTALIGFRRGRLGNIDAKWETAVTQNIGFDGTFFNGRLDFILDFWKKNTKDLLFQLPVVETIGYTSDAPFVNVGEMLNQGIDFQIATRGNLSSAFTYEVNVTGGFLKNEITYLADDVNYITSSIANPSYRGIQPIRNQLGRSLSAFFGYQVEGLFSSAEEVANHATQDGAAPGRFKFKDVDGNGEITPADRTYLGDPVPDFTGGVNFTLGYKNFDFSMYWYTSLGNEIWNQSKWFTDFYSTFEGAAISERLKNAWTPQNLNAEIPIVEKAANFSTSNEGSSFYVENGSYLRLQNVTVGYTMPASLLQRWKLEKLRVFASANNLLTITGYSGLDPAVGGNADLTFGVDVGNYPTTRGYTFGVNLSF